MRTPHEVALDLLEISEELDESRLAQAAGIAAKLVGGHEHGEVARHAAEYMVHKGEHFVRSKLSQMRAKRGATSSPAHRQVSNTRQVSVTEKVGPVEMESNKRLIRSDGPHYGPDPDVQREVKNQGYLARVAKAKIKREKISESLPEYSGTSPEKTGAVQPKGYKNNTNRVKPKSGARGDGFYRDGSEENSARVKMTDGSAM